MSDYGGTITVKGRNMIAGLLATEKLQLTKIVVGSGQMPVGKELIDMTELVHPEANATSTFPTYKDGVVSMIVEYRNDMNGGLDHKFWLSEFGIFAKTETQAEVLFYYATLGDSPQPVNPYSDNRIDIRRYPISIVVALEQDQVEITYNPGSFITAAEAQEIIEELVKSEMITLSQKMINVKVPFIVPKNKWVYSNNAPSSLFPYVAEVDCEECLEKHYPIFAIDFGSMLIAKNTGMCPTIEAGNKKVKFFAESLAPADIAGVLTLFNTEGILIGSIKDNDGTLTMETEFTKPTDNFIINSSGDFESSMQGSINSNGILSLTKNN